MAVVDEIITVLSMRVSPESKRAVEQMAKSAKKVKDTQAKAAKATKTNATETEKANASLVTRLAILAKAGNKSTKSFGDSLKELNLAIPLVGVTVGVALLKVAAMTAGFSRAATASKRLGDSIGVNFKTIQKLRTLGVLLGSDPNVLVNIVSKIQATGLFRDPLAGLQTFADQFAALSPQAARIAGGVKGFSPEQVRITTLFAGGKLKTLLAKAEAIKPALTDEQEKSQVALTKAMDEASQALSNFGRSIALAIAPVETAFFKGITTLLTHPASSLEGLIVKKLDGDSKIRDFVRNFIISPGGTLSRLATPSVISARIPASTVASASQISNQTNQSNTTFNIHGQSDEVATASAVLRKRQRGFTNLGIAQARIAPGVVR